MNIYINHYVLFVLYLCMCKQEKEWVAKRYIIQRIKERKLNLFGHICRMEDNRVVKEVVFEEMEGKQKEEDQE